MTDSPEEVIETLRRAYNKGARVRVDPTDGRWFIAGLESIYVDSQHTAVMDGERFNAVFWWEDMVTTPEWESGGCVTAFEDGNGGWQQPVVSWTIETDSEGYPIDEYACEVKSVQIVDG